MKAVVVQHEEHEGLGLLGKPLRDLGFTLTTRFRPVEHRDVEAESLVLLGGSMSLVSPERHPFLLAEGAWVTVECESRLAGVAQGRACGAPRRFAPSR